MKPLKAELPRPYCARMAREKVAAVAAEPMRSCSVRDTTVALGRRILGKPADAAEAAAFLRRFRAPPPGDHRRRRATRRPALGARCVSTVKMKRLSDSEMNAYLATDDWQGKAGGYGIQGPAGAFIPWISGSFTGIVGLPLAETAALLQAAGYPLYGGRP